MKFVFFGTDTFSTAIIEKLISDFYYPEAIVTMPDQPSGRHHHELTPPAIKDVCIHHNIPCYQPKSSAEIKKTLTDLNADLFLVASYGKIIPSEVLAIPKLGSINVHTSLLPEYRGPSPIQAAIRDGKDETGITIMAMDEEMDHGDIYLQKKVEIEETDTYRSLHSKLAYHSADTLGKALPDILSGKLTAKPQNHAKATFTKILKKADSQIDWNKPAKEIDCLIRSAYDWPIAWTTLPDGKRLQIISASPITASDESPQLQPGQLSVSKSAVLVGTAQGNLSLIRMQVEGKKEMDQEQFCSGYQRFHNQQLG